MGGGRVELVGVRLIVLLGGWVVDGESVDLDGATDCNALHSLRLEGRAVFVLVIRLVEIDTGKEREPGAGVRRDVVNKFKRGDEFTIAL